MLSFVRTSMVTAIAALAVAVPAVAAAPPPDVQHVRGVVTAVSADSLSVDTGSGTRTIALPKATKYIGAVKSSLADVKDGTFIGSANVPGPGAARALELVVFPASMKGTGEGNYAWDLPAQPGDTGGMKMSKMTNGTVQSSSGNMQMSKMTNGTVQSGSNEMKMSKMTNGTVSKATGHTYVVNYGSGTQTINVPDGAPVVRFVPALHANVVKGAHVFVVATKGGAAMAKAVIVGEQGTVPPM